MSSEIQPAGASTPFDSIRHVDEQGREYWSARELQPLLDYTKWSNFERPLNEAIAICQREGDESVRQNFTAIGKVSGSRGPQSSDYHLTRHACYLIAQSCDGRKKAVAQAKTYFAIKTRQREEDEQDIIVDDAAEIEQWKVRAIRALMSHGFSYAYAKNRVTGILVRKDIEKRWVLIGLTDEEIGMLTNQMHMGTFDISIDQHRALKQFPEIRVGTIIRHKGNLRPALTPMEQAVITMAESVTLGLHDERDTQGFLAAARDVDDGAAFAKDARLRLEKLIGRPIVSTRNMLKEPDGGIFGDMGPLLELDEEKEGC